MQQFKFDKLISASSRKRHLDNIKLLISDDDFQTDVRELRCDVRILSTGLKSDKKIQKWQTWLEYETDRIMDSRKFIEQETTINKKNGTRNLNLSMIKKQQQLHYNKTPLSQLNFGLKLIMDKFHLPPNYLDYIKRYVITGKISAPQHSYEGGFYDQGVKARNARYIPINIYTMLTDDEFAELKSYLRTVGKDVLRKYGTLNNIDRNLKIEKWLKGKSSSKRILKDAAVHFFGSEKHIKKVHDIMTDLKTLRRKRFS